MIPHRWWSVKEWKLALSLRAEMLERLIVAYNSEEQGKGGVNASV